MVSRTKIKEILLNGIRNPEDEIALKEWKNYMQKSKKHKYDTPQEITDSIISFIDYNLATNSFKNPIAQELATNIKNDINNMIPIDDLKERKKEQETLILQKKQNSYQKRAGFTNSIILLYVVFNLGLFLACLLLIM